MAPLLRVIGVLALAALAAAQCDPEVLAGAACLSLLQLSLNLCRAVGIATRPPRAVTDGSGGQAVKGRIGWGGLWGGPCMRFCCFFAAPRTLPRIVNRLCCEVVTV